MNLLFFINIRMCSCRIENNEFCKNSGTKKILERWKLENLHIRLSFNFISLGLLDVRCPAAQNISEIVFGSTER